VPGEATPPPPAHTHKGLRHPPYVDLLRLKAKATTNAVVQRRDARAYTKTHTLIHMKAHTLAHTAYTPTHTHWHTHTQKGEKGAESSGGYYHLRQPAASQRCQGLGLGTRV